MNKYLKNFLQRGVAFGGLGPIIGAIVFLSLHFSIPGFSLNGIEAFLAIISTYILAFLQAGASVFNEIESWPIAKSLLCHFSLVYVAYLGCYLVNSWIPFEWPVIIIFTLIFVITYFAIWITVYLIIKKTSKELNSKLGK